MGKLDELKKAIRETITPDDVIKALLSQMKTNQITKDPEKIHKAIYTLKQKYGYYFQEFEFDCSGLTPFSDLLDRILFRLETTSNLGTVNPRYLIYELTQDTKQDLKDDSLVKFNPEDQKRLTAISWEFEKLVEILP